MRELPDVMLLGVDCVDIERLLYGAAICERSLRFGATRMLSSLPHAHRSVVPIAPIRSREEYSTFAVKQIGAYVETPFALVIQYDGFVLNPDAWSDEFLAYDYIGAPWTMPEGRIVGNGGFSLRSKRLLDLLRSDDQIVDPSSLADPEPEDWYICVTAKEYLQRRGIRFAPAELAWQFSFEGDEAHGVTWSGQFGFHGLRWTDISPWLRANPDVQIDNTLDSASQAIKDTAES